jgi:hypothetical protein
MWLSGDDMPESARYGRAGTVEPALMRERRHMFRAALGLVPIPSRSRDFFVGSMHPHLGVGGGTGRVGDLPEASIAY